MFLKQWNVNSDSVRVKKLDLALLMMISNKDPTKKKLVCFKIVTIENKSSAKKNCGSVVGGTKLKKKCGREKAC